MQLQILVTALTSVMKTLGSISSVYFCCVLALTLFSVPPAGSSFSSSGRWRRCASIVVAHGIRYGLCRYSHDRKGSSLDFQKSPFSDLIWRGTKVDLSRLRRTLGRLLRNSCCRLVASLVRSLNLVFCLPWFSLIKNPLSFWVASMYVSYAVPLYPILLDLSFCALSGVFFIADKRLRGSNTIVCVAKKFNFVVFFV